MAQVDLFTHLRNWLQSVEEERTDIRAKLELGLGPCASGPRHDFDRGTCMRCGALSDTSERQYAFAEQTFGLSESGVRLLLEHLTPLAPS